jgi:flavodoxin
MSVTSEKPRAIRDSRKVFWFSDFVSGMRLIYDMVIEKGAKVIGSWEDKGYSYESSASIIDGKFIGLALDEDNQSELTDSRIATWCEALKSTLKECA